MRLTKRQGEPNQNLLSAGLSTSRNKESVLRSE